MNDGVFHHDTFASGLMLIRGWKFGVQFWMREDDALILNFEPKFVPKGVKFRIGILIKSLMRVEIDEEYILPSARDTYLELYELLPHAYSTCYCAFDDTKKLYLTETKPK